MSDLQGFVKSFASFSWALAVFGVSQGGKVFKGLPTSSPTLTATRSFNATTATMQDQYDSLDSRVYNAGNAVQQAAIDVTFNFFTPNTFNPRTILETNRNLLRWGFGLAAQLIPGGKVGNGGPPVGWGPVNRSDAELF
jgi:hypothetical protein